MSTPKFIKKLAVLVAIEATVGTIVVPVAGVALRSVVSSWGAGINLLEVLIQRAGQVVSKDLLSEQGLGRPHERYDRSIDVHLSSIRRKLPPLPDGRSRIQAVFRRGYQLLVD